ncbi:hypothetical protein D3C86_1380950 [compost metagenome]
MDREFDIKIDYFVKMINASEFMHQVNTFDVIEKNMKMLKKEEDEFKKQVEEMLENKNYSNVITIEMKDLFAKYLSEDWVYFSKNEYLNECLDHLSTAMNNYQLILSKSFFEKKKDLLNFNIQLMANK